MTWKSLCVLTGETFEVCADLRAQMQLKTWNTLQFCSIKISVLLLRSRKRSALTLHEDWANRESYVLAVNSQLWDIHPSQLLYT